MRNFTLYKWLLAVLLLLMPLVADATGLGRLAVLSSLGQPLDAEIELMSVGKEDVRNLSARIASPDAYRRANLQYNAVLAGLRLAVQTRPDGRHYVKVTSTRPVSEPFIDLLIELTWSSGRLTRDYTALIDPPGYAPAQAMAPATVEPQTRPAPTTRAPVAAVAPAGPAAPVGTSPVAVPGGKEYGPIRRGETLFSIAGGLKPEGVTLEQMLVGLYRANPDAFMKNMNNMKTGKILRVPDAENLTSVTQKEAVREFKAQVSDWNAYRQTLAGAAGTAPESRTAASGKITSRVEEKESGGAKDVVRLSKGEPATGAAGDGKKRVTRADQVRALEEELIAREKALNDANERIAQLNKTLEDLQEKLAIKSQGMAAAQQEAVKPEMKKPESSATAMEAKKEGTEASGKPAAAVAPSESKPMTKPKPKRVVPPPPPERSLVDTLLGDPMYLAAGGGVILLGGLAFFMARRRRSRTSEEDAPERAAPTLSGGASVAAATEPEAPPSTTSAQSTAAAVATASGDEIDPLAEAEVYIAYGRDQQAEAILKDALAKNPNSENVQLKLLEIYSSRKDKSSFDAAADKFNKLTGGQGANWLRVAAMGYALSPDNPAYKAGKNSTEAVESTGAGVADVDFDLGAPATPRSAAPETPGEKTAVMEPGSVRAMTESAEQTHTESALPDFTLDVPDAGSPTTTDIALEAQAAAGRTMDFNIELPRADEPQDSTKENAVAPQQVGDDGAGLDFKLDIPDVDLNLDEKPAASAGAVGEKDAHWHDVQTKFDLVRAYQEMGDKYGARQLLQEVCEEGDAQQQAEAKKVLDSLG